MTFLDRLVSPSGRHLPIASEISALGTGMLGAERDRYTRPPPLLPVFIVAQYKCGTSWLLAALAAHPDMVGIREIDVIRGAYRSEDDQLRPASPEERLEYFFGRTAWCPEYPPPDALPRRPGDLSKPQGYSDLPPDVMSNLHDAIESAGTPLQALDAFVRGVTPTGPDAPKQIVLKAADQIAVFDALGEWAPTAKKLAITRDGRDAAISALHYKRLMRDRPWSTGLSDYPSLVKGWAHIARMLATRVRMGDLRLVRYEDVTADFFGTIRSILTWLGLDADEATLAAIERRSSFERKTGRPRGTPGEGILRKGAVGEWMDTLEDDEQEEAWQLAGRELEAFGYTRSGAIAPLPDDLTG